VVGALVAAAPTEAASPCPGAESVPKAGTLEEAEKATLCLVNRERAQAGRRPLRDSASLAGAAARHSRDMVARRYFAHESLDGRDLADRLLAGGWAPRRGAWRAGENIAWGAFDWATPTSIVEAWMESPGHRFNMLDGRFREAGVGATSGTPKRSRPTGTTYTIDFGTR
jgi:uncharacterized protein YkwD